MTAPASTATVTARQRELLVLVDAITDALNARLPGLIANEVAKQLAAIHPTRVEDVPDNEEWLRDIAAQHFRARADTHFARLLPLAQEVRP